MSARPLRQLTGRNLLSWSAFALLLVYSLVSMFLSNPDLVGSSVAGRLVVALLGLALLYSLLWLLGRAIRAVPAIGSSPWRVLLALFIVSLVRAVVVAWLLDVFAVTPGIDWERRLSGSVVGFAAAMVLIDLAIGSVRGHRARVNELVGRQQAARLAREVAIEAIVEQRDAVVASVRAQLNERVDSLVGVPPAEALEALHATATEVVRPLSRELADSGVPIEVPEAQLRRPRFSMRSFLADATFGAPLSPLWVAVLLAAFGGPFMVLAVDWFEGIVLLVIGMVIVWVLLSIANVVMARLIPPASSFVRACVLVVLVIAAGGLLAWSSLATLAWPPALLDRVLLGELTLVPTLALLLVAARASVAQEDRIEHELEAAAFELAWASTRVQCLRWREQRSVARAMHGPVQGAIGAAVVRLEQGLIAGTADAVLVDAIRKQLIDVFSSFDAHAQVSADVEAGLVELRDVWAGVHDISWTIAPDACSTIRDDTLAGFAMRELAAEGCWNAIRHARPSRIQVALSKAEPRILRLEVHDDGAPASGGRAPERGSALPGLGTRMLDEMALSWTRTHDVGSTTLVAHVPCIG